MTQAALFALALVLLSPSPASAQLTTSAQLNGVGSLALPALPASGAPFTIEGWVYPRTHAHYGRLLDLGNGAASDNILLAASDGTSGRPNLTVFSGGQGVLSIIAPNPIPLNAWTHLAAVLNSDRSGSLYVNGQLVATGTASALPQSLARSANFIGRSNWSSDALFDGSVADVRYWNVARTLAQIQAGMTVGSISGATSGLVAAYPFGATGQPVLNDVSGNNRTLTASGTVVYPSVGPASAQVTTSAQLNGVGNLVMPALPALGRAVTVEGWVYPRSHSAWQRILDIGNGAPLNNIVLMASEDTTGRPSFSVLSGAVTAPNPIPLSTWTHVAGVVDSDRSVRLYVNGQLVASATATSQIDDVARTSNFIGKSNWPGESPVNGSLADVRVWNTARTQAQIQAGMTLGSISGATSGLVAAYPFGATGQPVLNDVSGNNRTLTPSGSIAYQTAGPASPLPGPADDVAVADVVGSSYFAAPTFPAMGSAITLEGWVYPRSVANWGRIVEVAADGGNGSSSLVLFTSGGSSGRPNFTVMSRNVSWPLSLDAPNPLPLNTWSHVAAVLNPDRSVQMYINGQLVASGTSSSSPPNVARTFNLIGKADTGDGNTMFADVRVWSTARTAAQVQSTLPLGSITGPATGLVAAYPFGQTGQPALNDVSGNNFTLTQVGAVRFRSAATDRFSARMAGAGHLAMPTLSTVSLPITIESWVYPTALVGWARAVDLGDGNGTMINLLTSSGGSGRPSLHVLSGWGDAGAIVATNTLPLNTWTHLAGVIGADRSMKLYVNGVEAASVASSGVPTSYNLASNRIGLDNYGGDTFFKGSIGDVRVWNTARTQAQIQANMVAGSISGAVTGLLGAYPFGATGQAPLADVSGNNRTLTRSGVVEFDVSPSSTPPRTSSAWLDGASGSYLSMGSTVAVTGAFTVEGWIRPTSYAESARLVDYGGSSDNILLVSSVMTSGKPQFIVNRAGSAVLGLTAPDALPLNTWSHVAAVINADRSGALYVNGRLVASGTASQLPNVTGTLSGLIGGNRWGGASIHGGMADVRIWTVGRTQAEIQSSMPVGSISGAVTGLVAAYPFGATGQPVLNDVSGNNRTLTGSGNVQFQVLGPSSPTAAAADAVMTAHLDGTDYWSMPSLPAMGPSVTLEAWVNPRSVANWGRIVEVSSDSGNGASTLLIASSAGTSGRPNFTVMFRGVSFLLSLDAPNPLPLNTWSHVAGVLNADRSAQLYVNGQLVASGTASSSPPNAARTFNRVGWAELNDGNTSFADVRVWSTARTAAQIQAALPVGSIVGPATGLVAAYPFGSTGAEVLADVSGNGRNLTQEGTPEYRKTGPGFLSAQGFQGSASLVTSAGQLILPNNNSHTGTTTIGGGSVQVGTGGTTGSLGTGNVANNGILTFDRSDDFTVANAISGSGSLFKRGSGTMTLSAVNSYLGGTFIDGGTLLLAADGGEVGRIRGAVTVGPQGRLLLQGVNTLGYGPGTKVDSITINGGLVESTANNDNGWGVAYVFTGGELRSNGGVASTSANSRFSMGNGTTVTTLASTTTALISGDVRIRQDNPNNILPIDVADGAASPDLLITAGISQQSVTGGITKTGGGTLALAGPASYAGTITISGGTLQVGNGSTHGALGTGNVVNNATLTFNRSDNITVANAISGSGALFMQGAGVLTLSGGNSFTGGLTVQAGSVALTGGIANNAGNTITVNSGATFSINRSDAFGGHDTTPLTPFVVQSGAILQAGDGLFNVMGPITLRGGTLRSTSGRTNANGWSFALRGTVTVDGGATTSVLEGPGMALGATAVSSGTFDVADGSAADDLLVSGGLINGPASTFPNMQASGLVKTGAGRMTLTGTNAYTGTTTVSAGTLQVGNGGTTGTLGTGNVVNNATLIFNRSDTLTAANAISGTGTLTQQGAGTLVLSGANSYSGISTIASGTVQVGAGGSAGSLGSGNVVNNSALVLNRNDAFTVANVISGTGTLAVQGGGIATLTGANTYSGVSTITAGTLQVGNGGTTGALGSGNVVNNGTLAFNRSDNITVANVVSGTGGVRKQGNGTLTLSAANTFSGATEITGGTLALGASGTLGTSSGITIAGGSALDVTARSGGLVMSSGRTLANTGGSASLRGNINASAPTLSMSFDGTNPSFSIASGTLTLAANTPVQITKTGSALAAGLYKVISKGSGGSVAGVAPAAVTVTGAGGFPTSLSIVNGELILQVGTPVTIAIAGLAQSYNATPRAVSITTTPASIATAVTYNGSTTVPTAVGTYAVVATVTAPGYYGSASASLVVNKGLASIRLGNLFQNYDGTARRVVALTEPSGLAVSFTYDGKASAPTNRGIYKVVATISNPNYEGSTNGVLRVRAANPGSLAAANPQPPAFMNHQGFLQDNAGSPLGSPNPRNYDLVFRIFATSLGGSALWTEQQNVTLDQGRYSVTLGDGMPVGVEPWPALDTVLASGSGTARFLQVTVRGIGVGGSDIVMMPRYELLSQPYAFLARHAETADTLVDSNGVPVVRVAVNNVGISVEQPNATFDVGGTLLATSMSTPGNADVTGILTASSFVGRGTIPLGGIVVWTGGTPPQGWALCDGRTANGRRTPDLRSRFVVAQGTGTGLTTRFVGQTGGQESVSLDWTNMGGHAHMFDPGPTWTWTTGSGDHSHQYSSHAIDRGSWLAQSAGWTLDSAVRAQWHDDSMPHEANNFLPIFSISRGRHRHNFEDNGYTSGAGGGQPHPNMPPFHVLAYIMRVE